MYVPFLMFEIFDVSKTKMELLPNFGAVIILLNKSLMNMPRMVYAQNVSLVKYN